jgi:hypothetical protein
MTRCFFTVDLEDCYQLQFYKLYGQIIDVDESFNYALDELLQLLSQRQIKGTFFVLGIIAKTNPEVLIRIINHGHEIGSHGMYHLNYRNVSDEIWMNDVQESKFLIESVVNKKIVGFRAPFFAAPRNYQKYLKFLYSLGFLYDSSYHVSPLLKISVKELEYGVSFPLADLKIMELTPSYYSSLFRIPLYGGSYFRLLPTNLLTFLLTNFRGNLMFYMHPYEVYESPLELLEKCTSFFGSLRTKMRLVFNNYNRNNFMKKVRLLSLRRYNFITIEQFYHEFSNPER